jgi:hypothetical protein
MILLNKENIKITNNAYKVGFYSLNTILILEMRIIIYKINHNRNSYSMLFKSGRCIRIKRRRRNWIYSNLEINYIITKDYHCYNNTLLHYHSTLNKRDKEIRLSTKIYKNQSSSIIIIWYQEYLRI